MAATRPKSDKTFVIPPLRVPCELVERIDKYVEYLNKGETYGRSWNRAAAIRRLLHEALEHFNKTTFSGASMQER